MTIAFTICSYNYSALAKVLYSSLKENNPDIKFFFGLVDSEENFRKLQSMLPADMNVFLIDNNIVKGFDDMKKRYSITELNTAVKPFVFEHLFNSDPLCEQLLYFDPDIEIFHPLKDEMLAVFNEYDIILTPHITRPVLEDPMADIERASLNTGIFNLGFLGLKRSEISNSLLNWWKQRLTSFGYVNVYVGFFTDQIWINFVPLFYDKVKIFKHAGANVAHWNLPERNIFKVNGKYFVNDEKSPLLFYHFSAFTHFIDEPPGENKPHSKFPPEFDQRQASVDELIFSYQKKLVEAGQKEFFGQKPSKQKVLFSPKEKLKNIILGQLRKRGFEVCRTMSYYERNKLISRNPEVSK